MGSCKLNKSFEDLFQQGYQIFTWGSGSAFEFLKRSPVESPQQMAYEKVLESREKWGVVNSQQFGLKLLRSSERVAFFGTTITFLNTPGLTPLPHFSDGYFNLVGSILPPDSEFAEAFNYHLGRLAETGVLESILREFLETDWHGSNLREAQAITLGFENLLAPFIILSLGLLSGLVVALLERMIGCFY